MTSIQVKEVLHLRNFKIDIAENDRKHLIITGKNGTGKTVLMNAILGYFNCIINTVTPSIAQVAKAASGVELSFNNATSIDAINKEIHDRHFLVAYYAAEREMKMQESSNPQKPNLQQKADIKETKTDQFLYFLSDYKIQEALARNDNQQEDADEISAWFVNFTDLLRELFEDKELELNFNYKDYSFYIHTQGKRFKFTQLSAGYSAVLDIVADLILKMQVPGSYTRVYNMPGIVLIDEIETHLHLELQRVILPILTRIFPNIQFIVTTHSPFILNSLKDATAFDLESKQAITDLTDYSYEALAEGYFGVKTESSSVEIRLQRLNELIHQPELSKAEKMELNELLEDFEKAPEFAAPHIKAEYEMIKLKMGEKGRLQ